MICEYQKELYLGEDLARDDPVPHRGTCGFICLQRSMGLSSWIDVAELFNQHRDHPIFSAGTRARIIRLYQFVESLSDLSEEGRENAFIGSDLYLTDRMRKCSFYTFANSLLSLTYCYF